MRKFKVAGIIILCLTLAVSVTYAKGITYDFDKIDVVYVAEFDIKPVDVTPDNWLVQLAGGENKPVHVLYGTVQLIKNGKTGNTEDFIKVTGEAGSRRFLANSMSYDKPVTRSFFWSAKTVEGNTVTKDFSGKIQSLTVIRTQGNDTDNTQIQITASNDGNKASEEFWDQKLSGSVYKLVEDTLKSVEK